MTNTVIHEAKPANKKRLFLYAIVIGWIIIQYNAPLYQSGHTERMLWQHYGLGAIYITSSLLGTVLLVATLYLSERQMRPGYLIANLYLGMTAMVIAVEFYLSIKNVDLLINIHQQSRELRGLPTTPVEALKEMITANYLLAFAAIFIAGLAAIAYLLYKKRHHYVNNFSIVKILKN